MKDTTQQAFLLHFLDETKPQGTLPQYLQGVFKSLTRRVFFFKCLQWFFLENFPMGLAVSQGPYLNTSKWLFELLLLLPLYPNFRSQPFHNQNQVKVCTMCNVQETEQEVTIMKITSCQSGSLRFFRDTLEGLISMGT